MGCVGNYWSNYPCTVVVDVLVLFSKYEVLPSVRNTPGCYSTGAVVAAVCQDA